MCDFSAYGGVNAEWLAVDASTPARPEHSLSERQQAVNSWRENLAATAMLMLGPRLTTVDYTVPTRDGSSVEARTYRPLCVSPSAKLPVYIHLHGGGFFFGTLSSEDGICARIALEANVVVLNVNYRHTPQFTYPTPFDDAQDAFAWLHAHIDEVGGDPAKVVLGGISAGAHITASLVLEQHLGRALTDLPPPAGQVLMIPPVAHVDCYSKLLRQMKSPEVSSYKENEGAPILPLPVIRFFSDLLKAGNPPDEDDTKLNPGNVEPTKVRGLPPAVFGICGLDPLRDEGLLYAKMLTAEGVPTSIHVFKGVPHGFRRWGDKLSLSKDWDEVMEQGILWAVGRPEATGRFDIQLHE